MPTIEIFEPAGCCATSSVVIDPAAIHFNADMDWSKQQGLAIQRYNLLKNPQSFLSNPRVKEFLDLSGAQSLPLTLVDGAVALAGRLPNREELARWSGVAPQPLRNVQKITRVNSLSAEHLRRNGVVPFWQD